MNTTDLSMFGAPKNTEDARLRLNRGLYVLACALEYAEQCGLNVRDAMLPALGPKHPIADELDRVVIAIAKLGAWATSAPKSSSSTEINQ